ncbi:MAG: hypothetical protein COA99_07670 [Moraxellaceae bacterium]|nr:MAG: hypothetical protein COA99_07670 [Moraxellaceae bacterium]
MQRSPQGFLLFFSILASTLLTSNMATAADVDQQTASKIHAEPLADIAIVIKHEAVAAVKSLNASQLASEIAAIVKAVNVDVGDIVKKGEVLLSLDCRPYEIAMLRGKANGDAAAAKLLLTESQMNSAKKLAKKSFLPEDTLLQRQAQYQISIAEKAAAEAQIQQAQLDVSRCQIVSPFEAVIVERFAQEGEYIAPGMPVLKLMDTESIQVIARIAPKDIASVKGAESLNFNYRGKVMPLALTRLSGFQAEKTGTYTARLTFTGQMADIGSQGRLQWVDDYLYLPARLLVSRRGELGVFVVKGQSASFIKMPEALEGRSVKTTLPADTLIVTQGRSQLQDGDLVEVTSTTSPHTKTQ